MKKQKKKNLQGQRKQIIETTSLLSNVEYIPVDNIQEIKSIERGENGWREASVEKRGLVQCTSPQGYCLQSAHVR